MYLNCTDHAHCLKEMFRKCETPDMDNLDCMYSEDILNKHVKVQVSLKMFVEIKFFLGSVKNDNLKTLYEAVWWSFYLKN